MGNNILDAVAPWVHNPYKLVSLGEIMERFQPDYMASAVEVLVEFGELSRTHDPMDRVDARHWGSYRFPVVEFRDKCDRLGLVASVGIMDLTIKLLDARVLTYKDLGERVDQIRHLVDGELRTSLFLCVAASKGRMYSEPLEGWRDAITAFPSTAFDIEEASKCQALERSTAAVLHAMRVLEIGLSVFAKEFGVDYQRANWHNVIEGIEKAVRDLSPASGPNWKDKKDFYSDAANSFMFFKDAWRNHAMHVRQTFDGERSRRILDHVQAFMVRLSTQLAE